jgi:hypothetical protein
VANLVHVYAPLLHAARFEAVPFGERLNFMAGGTSGRREDGALNGLTILALSYKFEFSDGHRSVGFGASGAMVRNRTVDVIRVAFLKFGLWSVPI